MALNFDYENEIGNNPHPLIAYDTKSNLFNYYINSNKEKDKVSDYLYGIYDNVNFSNEGSRITTKDVSRIGVRSVQNIGAVAFYKDAITGNCYIIKTINYSNPVLSLVEISNNKLHIKINAPSDVNYTYYRVIARQGNFAAEYIMYNNEEYFNPPLVKGEYEVYCYGYDNVNKIMSGNSNTEILTVIVGKDNWKPYSSATYDALIARIESLENDVDDIHEEIDGVGDMIDDLNGEVI